MDIKHSYTSADSIPPKLLLNSGVKDLLPIHVQWMPTNKCNLNCKFCSCSERNKSLEMDITKAKAVIQELSGLGCKAVTVTGGGEPLCHPQIVEMLECFAEHDIAIGLVTNGTLINKLDKKTLSLLTWCRISSGDDRQLTPRYQKLLESVVGSSANVDWAFSHVVTHNADFQNIRNLVNFANDWKFTHVRIVADILNADILDIEPLREYLSGVDSRVIYQARNKPVPSKSCAIGYVKPVIDPEFKMYLCCGVQYALEEPSKDVPRQLCMGSAFNLAEIYGPERKLFHVNCIRCYYESYNAVLRPLTQGITHKEFL